jgi:hypothetical protein
MSDVPNGDLLTRQPGTATSPPPEHDNSSPEQAVEEIRAQLDTERRSREAAEADARNATREAADAKARATAADTGAWAAQEQAVDTGLKAQASLVDQAKRTIAEATAAGDGSAAAEAYQLLAEATSNLGRLNDRKAWLESQKTQRQTQPAQQPASNAVRVTTPGGAMEVDPASKQWMDDHARFYTDGAYYNHAVAAHSTVVADGIQPGSPAYFRALTDQMQRFERFEAYERGEAQPNGNGQQPMPQHRSQPRASSMGAPVSRSTTPVSRDGTHDPLAIARKIGANVTVDDLREFARVNGYGRDETGFQRYLKDQQEIADIERTGGDTGLRVDGVYR